MNGAIQGYYAASAPVDPDRPPLTGDVRADVCVIGGGYTGLSAALHAARAGAKVVLLEAETIGFAASGRNGGQIHPGHRKAQAELEAWLGQQHARDLWTLSEEARDLAFELGSEDCDLRPGLVIAAHNAAALRALATEAEHLQAHYSYTSLSMLDPDEGRTLLGTGVYPGVRLDTRGGHLHPLKFARRLAKYAVAAGTVLYERTRAHAIEGNRVACSSGAVIADRIILACDAFSGRLAPELAPFIAHVESFLVATAPLDIDARMQVLPGDVAVADTRHVLDYYRKSIDHRLIFAGRESYWRPRADIAGLVRPRMLRVFPQLRDVRIDFAWRGTVGITRTRMPHFGRLSDRVLFGHGYSGHGVALSLVGGRALAEAALGRSEQFDVLARLPAETFPGGPFLRRPMVTAALMTLKLLDAL